MAKNAGFSPEVTGFDALLEESRAELLKLKEQYARHATDAEQLRTSLTKLRGIFFEAKLPADTGSKKGIDALEVNDDTGRPSRGARRDQIVRICKKLGRGKKSFRTRDVIAELRKVEGDLSDGVKSYTYAVLKTLDTDGLIAKKGRGTWMLG